MKTAAEIQSRFSFDMIFYFLFGLVTLLWPLAWLASLGNFLWVKWRKPLERGEFAKKILLGFSGVGLGLGFLWYLLLSPPAPYVYWQEFSEWPFRKVSDLRATSEGYFDSNVVHLRFKTDAVTVARLAKTRHLSRLSNVTDHQWEGMDVPEWGNPHVTAKWWVYTGKGQQETSFATQEVSLLYDPETKTAFYSFYGVD